MMEFRSCPSYPGYSAARDGTCRRDERARVLKDGSTKMLAEKIIKHVGRDQAYVTLEGTFIRWMALVEDAWPEDDRPRPSYPNGVVLTVQEWAAAMKTGR